MLLARGIMSPEDAILAVLNERDPGKTICPSEAARRLAGEDAEWRASMPKVRAAGRKLADDGRIEVLKKGKVVDPHTVKGVIRYRWKDEGS
jgi:hypothetical protein